MAKMKIYEITRSLEGRFPNIKSRDIINLLNENGFEVKSAQSNIEDLAIAFILNYFKNLSDKEELNNTPKAKKKTTTKKAKSTTADNKTSKTKVTDSENDVDDAKKSSASSPEKNAKGNVSEVKNAPEKVEEKASETEKKEEEKAKTEETQKSVEEKKNNENVVKAKEETKTEDKSEKAPKKEEENKNKDKKPENKDRKDRKDNKDNKDNRDNRDKKKNDKNFADKSFNDKEKSGKSKKFDKKENRNKGKSDSRDFSSDMKAAHDFETKPNRQRDNSKDKKNKNQERNAKQKYNRKKDSNFEYNPLYPDGIKPRKPKKNKNAAGAFIKPVVEKKEEESTDTIKEIRLPESLTIKELADKMKIQPSKLIKDQFMKGNIVTLNHSVTYEEAEEIALVYNYIAEMEEKVDVIAELLKEDEEDEELMVKRPPVVCVMGHVDHGKTSLLDAIRETHVTSREAGGITQHIGAYVTEINGQKITFLDTPGHEAFTAMRMRGAEATDIAVLVVAADDGVMPQTIEAINHAKVAGVEIIVAVNKIDKPSANIERVKQELIEHGLTAEDWGGDTIFVPVSAHTKEGIDNLLEMILLTADVSELKANPNRNARGVVIEAQLDKGRGPVATILVQKGTLKVGDNVAVGAAYGKVRAMTNDLGQRVTEATPSMPVEIIGLHDVPEAGEIFMAVDSDKEAKNIAATYVKESREKLLRDTKSKLTLDGLFDQIKAGEIKELDLIVKADVQGSVEAVKQSLLKLSNEEVQVRVIHAGVGAINESDVDLASASNAIIIGFNVRPDNTAKDKAEREKVDVRLYRIIYDAIEDIEAAMKGMLDPEYEEKVIAHLEVRQIFKASGIGIIAGSYVLDGKVERGALIRVYRQGELIHEGELQSLKRFKDDVKEVAANYECGIVIKDFSDIQEEDQIEAYKMVEVPR